MKRHLYALVAALCVGCSSASAPSPAPSGDASTFPAEPFVALVSDGGKLDFDLRSAPEQPPTRGVMILELTARGSSGAPADGLSVDLVPWMPAMGHGASVRPTVTPKGDGRYVIDDVDFFMPGQWQLRFTFSGPVEDHATVVLQIP
jgi:hypothetical protein